MEIAQGYLCSI